ncbi:alanine racemase [Lederbergia citrea]|uniref:Alanine racemase n=1 Tax=Lederbergia citrea TaxID=2833581 RepID=A0A942UST2_9BACI|nr:alanine racemase [Lederbergia citrea]MBS4178613.1 alanine racemase [Lederbergia citrea]MBS4205300.1 alanine racemase [Lederbergia citrea]MBS4224388.1 alanine racemase [Lederbergia citrea]
MIEQREFYRDTWAEIDLNALFENMCGIKDSLPKETRIFAAVKANAYGHGDIQVAKTALEAGAHGFVVAFLDEALNLRKNGITAPILVLGATRSEDAALAANNDISVAVFQIDWLSEAVKRIPAGKKLRVHIKCDTGMGRIGIKEEEELRRMEIMLNEADQFDFEGIFTHFATADQLEDSYYKKQLSRFKYFLGCLETIPKYIHAANSAAALCHNDSIFNTARIGIAIYGLSPSEEIEQLLPFSRKEVFSLHTKIIHVKKLTAGEKIGYGADYTASEDEWIATLPIGYADGWIRKLRGLKVIAADEMVPIVGRICMDQTMIKLPRNMPLGTEVTLIGGQGSHFISIDDIAKKLETINYEVICTITNRVPRVYKPIRKASEIFAEKLKKISK